MGKNNLKELIIRSFNQNGVEFKWYAKYDPRKGKWSLSTALIKMTPDLYVLDVNNVTQAQTLRRRAECAEELLRLVNFLISNGVDVNQIQMTLQTSYETLMQVSTTAYAFMYSMGFYRKCARNLINLWTMGNTSLYDAAAKKARIGANIFYIIPK